MRVALAQINTTVGDIWGNVEKMADTLERATDSGAELVAYPELTIPGYPPELYRGEHEGAPGVRRAGSRERGGRRGLCGPRRRPLQHLRPGVGRRGTAPLPQAVPAELRRFR